MKKIIFIITLVYSYALIGQEIDKKGKDFSAAIHYGINLYSENYLSKDFDGSIGLDLKYALYSDEKVRLQVGFTFDYLSNNKYLSKNSILVYNPNFGIEINAFKSNIRPFINLGYVFFNDEIEYTKLTLYNPTDPSFQGGSFKIKYSGITINPGFRIHASDLVFIDASYKYFPIKTNTTYSHKTNIHTLNIGVGVNF